jgi:DNA primase catalytic core
VLGVARIVRAAAARAHHLHGGIEIARRRATGDAHHFAVVALRRRGRSAVGLCPFHAEKTPSFTVSDERAFFHCFGCGEHGDVFAFVMKTESLAFPDAVRRVAQRFGVPVPEERDDRPSTEPIAAANAAAAEFFRTQLAAPGGARARAYLRERGLDEATIARFALGWAPGGDALARHLRVRNVAVEHAITAGLVLRRDRPDGRSPDQQRQRDAAQEIEHLGRRVRRRGPQELGDLFFDLTKLGPLSGTQ